MEETDGGCMGKPKQDNYSVLEKQSTMATSNGNNNELTAIAPISQQDYYYKMDHKYRGLLIVFNHQYFNRDTNQSVRTGTDKDVEKIKRTFEELKFEIHTYKDMTLVEIQKQIKHYVQQDHYHKERDCLAIFLLTHGDKDALYAKDTWYDPSKEIWGQFTSDKCPSLAGKPKLFFVQACQGSALDDGIKLVIPGPKPRTEFDGVYYYKMPSRADILVSYATQKGYYAFRNDINGSFWVTVLCEELSTHHKKRDLLNILTFVNLRVAVEFSSKNNTDNSKSGKKQIPYFESSLTRLLVFGEK